VRGGVAHLVALRLMAVATSLAAIVQLLLPLPTGVSRFLARPAVFPPATRFYADPDSPAAQWVHAHPDDRRAAAVRERIAVQPQGAWFADPDPGTVRQRVATLVRNAQAHGTLPVLVPYTVPRRDCDGRSGGGAADLATYRRWIAGFTQGIGKAPAVVILEPDSLALLDCLGPRQRAGRFAALSSAGRALRHYAPHARVYYDAGNSAWHSAPTMAERLRRAGISRYGEGIALNVSNFNTTGDEVRYALSVLKELGEPRLGAVIDTSRNGSGPAPGHPFCDPPDRKLGDVPTADTGIGWVDAFLWVKNPGQADGCVAAPGTFVPAYAYRATR
jgi:endoglucanase